MSFTSGPTSLTSAELPPGLTELSTPSLVQNSILCFCVFHPPVHLCNNKGEHRDSPPHQASRFSARKGKTELQHAFPSTQLQALDPKLRQTAFGDSSPCKDEGERPFSPARRGSAELTHSAGRNCCSAGCTGSGPGCRIPLGVGNWSAGAAARSCFVGHNSSVVHRCSAARRCSAGSKCSDRNCLAGWRNSWEEKSIEKVGRRANSPSLCIRLLKRLTPEGNAIMSHMCCCKLF